MTQDEMTRKLKQELLRLLSELIETVISERQAQPEPQGPTAPLPEQPVIQPVEPVQPPQPPRPTEQPELPERTRQEARQDEMAGRRRRIQDRARVRADERAVRMGREPHEWPQEPRVGVVEPVQPPPPLPQAEAPRREQDVVDAPEPAPARRRSPVEQGVGHSPVPQPMRPEAPPPPETTYVREETDDRRGELGEETSDLEGGSNRVEKALRDTMQTIARTLDRLASDLVSTQRRVEAIESETERDTRCL